MVTDAHHVVTLAFTIIFFLVVVVHTPPAHAAESLRGFRGTMIRRTDSTTGAINFTQAALESRRRLSFLAARSRADYKQQSSASGHLLDSNDTETVPLRLDGGGGSYDMEFSIGTPPQKLTALADTGSNLIWAMCGPAAAQGQGSTPSYHPDTSSTFTQLPCSDRLCTALGNSSRCAAGVECDYTYAYGFDGHDYVQGFLGRDTFTLGGGGGAGAGDAVPGVGFGCTTHYEGTYGESSAGLVGLGRGPLSLVSQLDAGTFMYCLTSDASKGSPLLFGSLANLTGAAGVQSTGLLENTNFYSVFLSSISIGSATIGVVGPQPDGVVFDSGTTFTYLADPAYTEAKAAFLSQTSGLTRVDVGRNDGFDACFVKPGNGGGLSGKVPTMVLHFDGDADMALPASNYVVEVYEGFVCWVVQRSPSVSIIGNIMQRDYLVLHDVRRSVLSFKPAKCEANEASGSPRPFFQFSITMLLCLYIYNLYTSVF